MLEKAAVLEVGGMEVAIAAVACWIALQSTLTINNPKLPIGTWELEMS
jgi:hypothetical protein